MFFSIPYCENGAEAVEDGNGGWILSCGSARVAVAAYSEEAGVLTEYANFCGRADMLGTGTSRYAERAALIREYAAWAESLPERNPGFCFRELCHRPIGPFRRVVYVESNDPSPADRELLAKGKGDDYRGVSNWFSAIPVEKSALIFNVAWSSSPARRAYAVSNGWGKDCEFSQPLETLKGVVNRLNGLGRGSWSVPGASDAIDLTSGWNTNKVPFYRANDDGSADIAFRFRGGEEVRVHGPVYGLVPLYAALQCKVREMIVARDAVLDRLGMTRTNAVYAESESPLAVKADAADLPGFIRVGETMMGRMERLLAVRPAAEARAMHDSALHLVRDEMREWNRNACIALGVPERNAAEGRALNDDELCFVARAFAAKLSGADYEFQNGPDKKPKAKTEGEARPLK